MQWGMGKMKAEVLVTISWHQALEAIWSIGGQNPAESFCLRDAEKLETVAGWIRMKLQSPQEKP